MVNEEESLVELTMKEGYAVLTMRKEPVNSLSLVMWQQLEQALDQLEADPTCHGLIITSGLKRDVFTAGNDLMELYAPRTTKERYCEFWITSNRFLCRLYRTRLSTIAAIKGACPAGGCMIAMCCDHRVMTNTGNIGLNEVQLGITVPKYWGLLMARLIGLKATDKLLMTGKLVTSLEAKVLGLVDQVVEGGAAAVIAAEKVMSQLIRLPHAAVAGTKRVLREDFCTAWAAHWTAEAEGAWAFLCLPVTLRVLEGALARLSSANRPQPKL
mmetsp:Transcript_21940/g.37522  ORF Transcript_21940/g.37522 Transcript_21940/m.37522 type:complete len:270 (-) Transcript_21940:474-1283(-)|eukprot:CAMPEP_0119104382 /NCGR_PEP_ID=MMETSP1180-20130426/2606_1 /TAXON_ID=3052 ORGANISM="Chlamydomonas cf sp, Strain CCMP681" /NCGR_SAMPLE_ID=MMETSP1180 /ASSEMBLY_ACC=CAM_ASM_000741 /LENGTH=269 /DNA_ID=CAMNT_0007089123 /DNA_START=228 /DNA_END=1037 /DNA_ORIENTATION=+